MKKPYSALFCNRKFLLSTIQAQNRTRYNQERNKGTLKRSKPKSSDTKKEDQRESSPKKVDQIEKSEDMARELSEKSEEQGQPSTRTETESTDTVEEAEKT